MKHYYNEGKEYLKSKEIHDKKYEGKMKMLVISYAGILITLILVFLFN